MPLWDVLQLYYANRIEIDSDCKVEDNPFACSVSAFRAWDARIGGRGLGKVIDGELKGPTEHLLGISNSLHNKEIHSLSTIQ